MPVNQIYDAIGKAGRKIRTVVRAAVFSKTPRNINARETLAQSQLHVGISLVIAQQNVKSRLLLLDEVILERQRLLVIGDDNVVNVDCLAYQRVGLRILESPFAKVRADPAAQVVRLANIDDLALGVFVQIHAG